MIKSYNMKHKTYNKNTAREEKSTPAGRQGFSMMELLVAMFISTLIMVTVVSAFASAFRAQKIARSTQRNIEDAKISLEYMAKIIRMSSNLTATSISDVSMYNKSLGGKCVKFTYNSGVITESSCAPTAASADNPCSIGNVSDCSSGAYETVDIINTLDNAAFYIPAYLPPAAYPNPIKRVTIRMKMKNDDNANLQTTVSLRDYKNINPTGQ
jgi:prepilin-type N-terminal cleavage/methylation domain-containing protein